MAALIGPLQLTLLLLAGCQVQAVPVSVQTAVLARLQVDPTNESRPIEAPGIVSPLVDESPLVINSTEVSPLEVAANSSSLLAVNTSNAASPLVVAAQNNDSTVGPPELAASNVDPPELATGIVDPPELAPGIVDPSELAPSIVDSPEFAPSNTLSLEVAPVAPVAPVTPLAPLAPPLAPVAPPLAPVAPLAPTSGGGGALLVQLPPFPQIQVPNFTVARTSPLRLSMCRRKLSILFCDVGVSYGFKIFLLISKVAVCLGCWKVCTLLTLLRLLECVYTVNFV